MRKYVVLDDGETHYVYHIGGNFVHGLMFGGMISSYAGQFDNEDEVNIQTGIGDLRFGVIGNIEEAYELLKQSIKENNAQTFQEYCECVQEVIIKYFGDFSNISERLSHYPPEEEVDAENYGKVSDLAHKNAAMCVERAMVAQNLLKTLGINSIFKMSGVINNGVPDSHAFNLIENDEKYYLFDATIPTMRDGKISPIICEIPKEIFDKIKSPVSSIGASIKVSHYNPLQKKNYEIIYEDGRKDVYEATNGKVK